MSDHELALKRFKRCVDAEEDNRKLMRDDLLFVKGGKEQWPVQVRQDREQNKKPMLTINRTKQYVKKVANGVKQQSPSIKLHPVEDSDEEQTEIFAGIIRHIEQSSGAKSAYNTAVVFTAKCGYGVWTVETEYQDDSFLQDIVIKRKKNPLSVYIDPDAQEVDKRDMMFAFEEDWIDRKIAEKKYGDFTEFDTASGDTKQWQTQDKVRIARYWEKVPIKKKLGQMPDGSVINLDEHPEAEQYAIAVRVADSHKVQVSLMSGDRFLEKPTDWAGKYIPIVPIYGEENTIDGVTEYQGLVRDLMDPQRMLNYWRTTSTETLALQPKAPYIMTPAQIAGHEPQWKNANHANTSVLLYNSDETAPPPQRQMPPQPSAAMVQEAMVAEDDMKGISGIYDAALGQRSNETSGIAIQSRQSQSDIANYEYIDGLEYGIEQTGRILVDLIPKIYDSERMVRVLGEDGTEDLKKINSIDPTGQKMNDITAGKYDVRVSMGPSYKTRRIEAAQTTLDMIQAVPAVAQVAPDLIVKNLDTPEAEEISKRLQKMLPPGIVDIDENSLEGQAQMQQAQQQAQIEQMAQQLQFAQMQAQLAKTQAETSKTESDALKSEVEALVKKQELIMGDISQMIDIAIAQRIQELVGNSAGNNMME